MKRMMNRTYDFGSWQLITGKHWKDAYINVKINRFDPGTETTIERSIAAEIIIDAMRLIKAGKPCHLVDVKKTIWYKHPQSTGWRLEG